MRRAILSTPRPTPPEEARAGRAPVPAEVRFLPMLAQVEPRELLPDARPSPEHGLDERQDEDGPDDRDRDRRDIFGVRPEDRVYQGSSLSFDLSVEEVWLAFHAGATLVAATPEMAHAGPDLSQLLTECGVTVLSSVPTLLAMLKEDVPTLRLLIFGGEACPEQLVERWARPGRRLVNTYGPTEATVIATYSVLFPGEPVTIAAARWPPKARAPASRAQRRPAAASG